MPPTRLIYASRRADRSAAALNEILEVSRINNRRDDITGALVVGDDFFMQVLEGDRTRVSGCLRRVMQDARHKDIELISVNLVPHRLFAQWGLQHIDAASLGTKLLRPFLTGDGFQPLQMPQSAIEGLCRVLSGMAGAASR